MNILNALYSEIIIKCTLPWDFSAITTGWVGGGSRPGQKGDVQRIGPVEKGKGKYNNNLRFSI